jgi:Na+/citrate or Na+/malate symporter
MTPTDIQGMVRSELQPGESLQWTGTADAGRAAVSALPAMIFGIPFAGFALFWITMAYHGTHAISRSSSNSAAGVFSFFPLFGLPFLLIGLGIVSTPLFAYLKALKTAYAITDKRILVITDGRTRTVKSCTPADIVSVDHRERAGGTGDVIIRTNSIMQTRNSFSQMTVGLLGVNNVKEVARLVLNLHSQRA